MCCRVPVRADVNHLCAVFAVTKLDSPGSRKLLSSCFHSAEADVTDSGYFGREIAFLLF